MIGETVEERLERKTKQMFAIKMALGWLEDSHPELAHLMRDNADFITIEKSDSYEVICIVRKEEQHLFFVFKITREPKSIELIKETKC